MKLSDRKKTFYFLFWLCALTSATFCYAQKNDFNFPSIEHITTQQGLSYNQVWSVMLDHRGFIWIATNYGLDRYDGYNFKVYNYDPADPNTISGGWFRSLFEDKDGMIWMSCSQGFYSFDPIKEKFIRYYHQPGNNNSLASEIHDGNMVMDSSGIIWISTFAGLNSFDPGKKKFEVFTHRENDPSSLSSNKILWLCTDDENNIWAITSANTVDVFNISTKKVKAHFFIGLAEMPGNKRKPVLTTISKGRNGNIWIGSENNGSYGYNTKTKSWKHFSDHPGSEYSFPYRGINTCYEDGAGNLLIAPIDGGLSHYETASGKFYFSKTFKAGVYSIAQDRSGKIWLACGDDGIFTCDPINKKIITIRNDEGNKNLLNSDFIVGFYPMNQNELFFNGTNGVYLFNTVTKKVNPFKILENGEDVFADNITWMIRQDSKGVLWFCTLNGLINYDPKTQLHHYFRYNENDSTSLSATSATSFVEDNSGKIWIATNGGGLDLLNPKTGKFKVFKVHRGENSISANYTQGMIKDSRGMIYIGSWYGGLIQLNPATETFKTFLHNPSDPNSISNDNTWPLYEDKNGFIWVGTIGGGLNVLDPSKEIFRTFTMKDGLPSNAVVNMIDDYEGKTWIGTYHGLASCTLPPNPFDKNIRINFRKYDMGDGLPSNELYYRGSYKDSYGTLFFSSNAGFFYFNPQDMKDNDFIPPVYITGFSLLNKPVSSTDTVSVLKSPIEFTQEISLNYRQNILSFTFAALNYIHPEKNRYAYKLDGYDTGWIYSDASRRFVTYTNLNPDKYVFKVKASNNDGAWNETPTELRIVITPPFWQTAWFRILLAVVVIGLFYTFYRYRIGQILLLQRIRNKIAADLHDDIGSTLNSISIFSEVARKDISKRDHALKMIGESSRRIVESMSDIVWSINPQNDSFDKIIFRIRSLSYNLLKAKKIECSFHADENLSGIKLPMDIRKNFYLIFKEALNNLVKYSQASHASILISREHGSITCVVRDDGVGFDITQEYTGNGLNNMKKRAEEISAILSIDSAVGKGTSIELNLKV